MQYTTAQIYNIFHNQSILFNVFYVIFNRNKLVPHSNSSNCAPIAWFRIFFRMDLLMENQRFFG